jgi:hypothetical protein
MRAAMKRPTREGWAVAGLIGLALALRLPGIGAGLPEVYEEAYPFKVGWTMWGWGPARGLDLNPHWFKYPGLVIDLQFLGQGLLYLILSATGSVQSTLDFRVLYQLDKTPFYLMGRSIMALLGALTVIPVFMLTRRVSGGGAGLAAAALVAVSPTLIAKSRVIEVDVTLTLLVACGLLAALRLSEGLTLRRALVAGVVTGLATTAKYPGVVLVVPCVIAIALGARAGRGASARPVARAIAWPVACAAFGVALLAAVFVVSPYLFLDFRSALADLAVEREHMRLGHFGSDLGPTWMSYLGTWFGGVAGPTVALASGAALILFLARRRPAWAVIAGGFVIAYAALLSSFAMKADRYLLPLLPAAIVFACALAAELCGRLAGKALAEAGTRAEHRARGDRGARGAKGARAAEARPALAPGRAAARGDRMGPALAGATVLLALPWLIAMPGLLAALRPDTRTLAKAWFEANVPAGAFVASEQYGPPLLGPLDLQAIDRDLLPALQQRGYEPRLYAVVSMPLFQVAPERSAPFYDPALHRVADVFIVTGSVRDRYRREPARFAAQLAFYDTLAASWDRWQEFPANGGPGPGITIYRQRGHAQVFAGRRPSPGTPALLAPGPPNGGEAYFYYNLGLNYELFGFVTEALPVYLEGMRSAAGDPGSATSCAERAAGILERVGRAADAGALLERAASQASRPADATRLRALRSRILSGGG